MPTKDTQQFSISVATIIKFLAILLGLGVIYLVRDIFAALIFAVIVASALEPAIEWLRERRVPRILGVILIYLAIGVLLFFFIYLVVPLLLDEFQSVAVVFPEIEGRLRLGIEQVESPLLPFFIKNLDGLLSMPTEYLGRLGGGLVGFAAGIFGGVFTFLLIIVFSVYLAAQEEGITNFLRLVTPLQHESYVVDLWKRSQKKLGRWVRAQMLLGAIVGVLIFFGLTFLGVKHALFFAIIAAVFEVIPVVGPILAAVPAVATALLSSPFSGILVTALYVVVQQIESHVIVPVVMRKAIGLSPLIVVLALVIGAKIGGFFGILLAVPITAVLAEFVNDWDRKKRPLMPE